ncbi:hypothetical protein TrLO_g8823 [Triparma laevis f. longispina]|uniref:TsaA-like domain-containing protein n=1 Tax=Triparma laevis f. longispina TaxID=1714387 RepID=A0A9W7E518_9STRA|nr:hypothetical protein TrLO_g8823 [Triparma laevis f. longispina]
MQSSLTSSSLFTLTLFLSLAPSSAYFLRRLGSFLRPVNRVGRTRPPPKSSAPLIDLPLHTPSLQITPIGQISSIYPLCVGTPRQGALSPTSRATIVLTPDANCVQGLESFSHIWILFHFHLNTEGKKVRSKIAPPSLGGKKVGVLSTRSPHRYNNVGFSLVKLEKIVIKKNKAILHVTGIDLCDGTPVIDVKPYVPHYDSMENASVPDWIDSGLKLRRRVIFSSGCKDNLNVKRLKFYDSVEDFYKTVQEILSCDVRSKYHTKKAREGNSSQPAVSKGVRVNLEEQEGVCRQQIDTVMVYFRVEKNVGREWGEGSGAEDFLEVIDMVHV